MKSESDLSSSSSDFDSDSDSDSDPNSRTFKPVSFLLFFPYSLSFFLTALKLTGQIPELAKECLIVETVNVFSRIVGRSLKKEEIRYSASKERIAFMSATCW